MPARSKSQQRLFGMVHAYQKGKLKNAPASIKSIADNISEEDAKHFAETKHNGLPEKKASLIKEARLGTIKYLVRALGGGSKGRSAVSSMRRGVSNWFASGALQAPEALQKEVATALSQSRLPARRLYGVIDPTGRLNSLRLNSAIKHNIGDPFSSTPSSTAKWMSDVRKSTGGKYSFTEPLPPLNETPLSFNPSDGVDFYRQNLPRMIDYSKNHYVVEKGLLNNLSGNLASTITYPLPSDMYTTIDILPNETMQQAIRRDLLSRLKRGVNPSTQHSIDAVNYTPIGLDSRPHSKYLQDYRSATITGNPEAIRQTVYGNSQVYNNPNLEIGGFMTPWGTRISASRNGNKLTYSPYIALHEITGHGVYDYGAYRPGFYKKNFNRMVAGRRNQRARSHRIFANRYGNGRSMLPDLNVVSYKDPIQILRQISPYVYTEIAANVKAFGHDSSKWPHIIRVGLGNSIRQKEMNAMLLQRMPGDTIIEKYNNLKMYRDLIANFIK